MGRAPSKIEKKKVEAWLTPSYLRKLEIIKDCREVEADDNAEAIRKAIDYLADAINNGEYSTKGRKIE